jgi:hypothetical protein
MPTGTAAFDKPDVHAVAEAIQVPHSHVCFCEMSKVTP